MAKSANHNQSLMLFIFHGGRGASQLNVCPGSISLVGKPSALWSRALHPIRSPFLFTLRLRQAGTAHLQREGWLFTPSVFLGAHQGSLAIFLPIRDMARLSFHPPPFLAKAMLPLPLPLSLLPVGKQLAGGLGSCLSQQVFSSPREAGEAKVGGSSHYRVSALCAHSAHILCIPGR